MLLRSLSASFPRALFAPDDGGGSAPADTGSSAPAADTGASSEASRPGELPREDDDEPKLSLDEQLSKVWDDAQKPKTERDERGRFLPRTPRDEAAADDGGADDDEFADDDRDPEAGADDGGDDDQPAGDDTEHGAKAPTVPMPRSWSKDKAEVWNSLTPEAQDYLTQRETEVTQALSRAGRAVHALREHQPVLNAVEPYRDYLASVGHHLGIAPAQLINDVLRFEHTLRTASSNDQKLEVLKDIVATYGVDVSPLIGAEAAQNLGARSDPRVEILARQVQQLTTKLTADDRAKAEAQAQSVQSHIEKAAADTVNFPYFAQVRPLMGAILNNHEDDGTMSMPDLLKMAYDMACRADPKIFERIQRDQRRKIEDEARQRTTSKTEAARRAAAGNVRTGVPSPSKRTLNDDLESVADRFYGRR